MKIIEMHKEDASHLSILQMDSIDNSECFNLFLLFRMVGSIHLEFFNMFKIGIQ